MLYDATSHKWHLYICEILTNKSIRRDYSLLKFINPKILRKLSIGQTAGDKPYSNVWYEAVK